jgi:hypothetical protein
VRVLPILRALTAFFEGQDVVTAGYTLDGRHLANFSHLSFTAPVCCLFKVGRVQGSGLRTLLSARYLPSRHLQVSCSCVSFPPLSAVSSRWAGACTVDINTTTMCGLHSACWRHVWRPCTRANHGLA